MLNKIPAEKMSNYDVHACTDISGFGLLGHLKEMSQSSKCNVELWFDKIPFLNEVKNLATAGIVPGGTFNNLDFVQTFVDFTNHPRIHQLMLSDAQTSGGLLVSMEKKEAESFLKELHEGSDQLYNIFCYRNQKLFNHLKKTFSHLYLKN